MEYTKDDRVKGAVSYIWIVGLIFFFIEKDNAFVRFHAAQGAALFACGVAVFILSIIPILGAILFGLYYLVAVIFSIIAAINSWNGQTFRIPGISALADLIIAKI